MPRTFSHTLLSIGLLLLALAGCDDGAASDAGPSADGGALLDGGGTTDAGAPADDAGPASDAGSSVYVACRFDPQPMCDAPFDLCNVYGGGSAPHHCTFTCASAATCPAPESGTATPVCEAGNGPEMVCKLDCSAGTCPDGMSCIGTGAGGNVRRCAYNP